MQSQQSYENNILEQKFKTISQKQQNQSQSNINYNNTNQVNQFQDKIFIQQNTSMSNMKMKMNMNMNKQKQLQNNKARQQQQQKTVQQQQQSQSKKQILFNNFSYFSQDQYVPCHLIYTSQQLPSSCLYLGDVSSALDIQFILQKKIKTVVTAGAQMDQVSFKSRPQIKHIIYSVLDHKNQNLIQYFDQFYQLVQKAFHKGSILVHCAAGISRSSTLVISYLMKKYIWTFKQAIKYVRERRPKVLPNLGFERQLKQYEKILLKQNQRKIKSKTSQSNKHNLYNNYGDNYNHANKNNNNFNNNNNNNNDDLSIKINYLKLSNPINKNRFTHQQQSKYKDFLHQQQDEQNSQQISMSQHRNNNNNKNININIKQGFGIFINNNSNNNDDNKEIKYKFKHNMFLNNFYYKNNKKNLNFMNQDGNNNININNLNNINNINNINNNNKATTISQLSSNKPYNLLSRNSKQVKTKSLLKNIQQNNYNNYKQQTNNNKINNINVNININHVHQSNNMNMNMNMYNINDYNDKSGDLLSPTYTNYYKNQNNHNVIGLMPSAISADNNQYGNKYIMNNNISNHANISHTLQKNKNFCSSNHYYQNIPHNINNQSNSLSKQIHQNNPKPNLPIFISKPSKKQLISINGLFDSAIIPIKYNQLQRAQTDSTNRSPFKNQFKYEERLNSLKKNNINIVNVNNSISNNVVGSININIGNVNNIGNNINNVGNINNNNNSNNINNNNNMNSNNQYRNTNINSLKKQQRNSLNYYQSQQNNTQDHKNTIKSHKSKQYKLKTIQNKNLSLLKPLQFSHLHQK